MPPPTILIKNRTHYTLYGQSIFIMLLSFMTLPQFILNMCFILTHDTNVLLNWLQIGTAFLSLTVFVLSHWSHVYALDSIGEQSLENALRAQLFWSKFQYYAEIFFYIYFVIIILEMLQCLPVLFEYFYYDNIDLDTMLIILGTFNGAKLLCFSYYIYKI